VGHLTAALTAAAATALILSRQSRNRSQNDRVSGGYMTDAHPDQVGDPGGAGA
jgi:hypothetical protein